jgi:CMP-N,N'-diacetyllegionaminic acid synthase
MEILITLCARGGSKGIPRKNVRLINGQPVIDLSIQVAKSFATKYNADIALSTDDNEIRNVAANLGVATNYARPEYLATDQAGKIETITHLLSFEEKERGKKYDYILDLDITSPLRNLLDLESAFELIKSDTKASNLFSVNPAARNPYFNMVEIQSNGYYGLVKKGSFLTRQSAPKVYDLNASFYFYRRSFFEQDNPVTINENSLIYVMPHICFDLDHALDFEFMEYLLVNNKLDFKL